MISFGARISTLKRDVTEYIQKRVEKDRAYKLEPGDLFVSNHKCYTKIYAGGEYINKKLEELSVETLCNIADKIHFRPLGDIIKKESGGRATLSQVCETKTGVKSEEMTFEIKKDIPLPGQVFRQEDERKVQRKGKHTNYRALPLKEMKVGECIIIHESNEGEINKHFTATKAGVAGLVKLMDTQKKFQVAKTHDYKVGVWRVE